MPKKTFLVEVGSRDESGLTYFLITHVQTESFVEGRYGSSSDVSATLEEEFGISEDCLDTASQGAAFLDNLQVDQAKRGKGIGSALIKKAISVLNKQEVSFICAFAAPEFEEHLEDLVRFYKKLNFKISEDCSQAGAVFVFHDSLAQKR